MGFSLLALPAQPQEATSTFQQPTLLAESSQVASLHAQANQFYQEGLSAQARGQTEQSMQAYQNALGVDPDFQAAYNNLAHVYFQSGHPERAIQIYQQAIRRFPNVPIFHRNLGVIYEGQGQIKKAKASFERYLQLKQTAEPPIETIVRNLRQHGVPHAEQRDYLNITSDTSQGMSLIWPPRLRPIRYYIQLADPSQADLQPAIQKALTTWQIATDHTLRFQETSTPEFAQIILSLEPGALAHCHQSVAKTRYQTNTVRSGRVYLHQVWITLQTGDASHPPTSERMRSFYRLTLHELGHALGIMGHSTHPQDIMYARPITHHLSTRDTHTVRRLYQLPAVSHFSMR